MTDFSTRGSSARNSFAGAGVALLLLATGIGIGGWGVSLNNRVANFEAGQQNIISEINKFAESTNKEIAALKQGSANAQALPSPMLPQQPPVPGK